MTAHIQGFCVCIEPEDGPRRELVSAGNRLVIGSDLKADLVVDDDDISPLHCEIVREPDGFVLRDLGSERGTWLSGVRVREVILPSDVYFELGSHRLFIRGVNQTETEPPSVESRTGESGSPAQRPPPSNVRVLPSIAPPGAGFGPHDGSSSEAPCKAVSIDVPFKVAKAGIVSAFEREYLTAMLARHNGNITASASAAELDRVHFLRLLDRYGLRKTKRMSR
jgi:pSer/pThr/pTyr-binding forkhead associated (FHA) protein